MFRGLFLHYLDKAFGAGDLNFFSAQRHLNEPAAFQRYLAPAHNTEWVVYAKRPFAGPAQVLNYVGRYTHRVAISNNRLVSMHEGKVGFHWKDYRDDNRQKTMTLPAEEFMSLPDPCVAERISPHPIFRLSQQLPSRAQACALPRTARDGADRSGG
jgi:hypothetical protein